MRFGTAGSGLCADADANADADADADGVDFYSSPHARIWGVLRVLPPGVQKDKGWMNARRIKRPIQPFQPFQPLPRNEYLDNR